MSLEMLVLGFAALIGGVASGAIHELAGKPAAVAWALLNVACLIVLYVL